MAVERAMYSRPRPDGVPYAARRSHAGEIAPTIHGAMYGVMYGSKDLPAGVNLSRMLLLPREVPRRHHAEGYGRYAQGAGHGPQRSVVGTLASRTVIVQ